MEAMATQQAAVATQQQVTARQQQDTAAQLAKVVGRLEEEYAHSLSTPGDVLNNWTAHKLVVTLPDVEDGVVTHLKSVLAEWKLGTSENEWNVQAMPHLQSFCTDMGLTNTVHDTHLRFYLTSSVRRCGEYGRCEMRIVHSSRCVWVSVRPFFRVVGSKQEGPGPGCVRDEAGDILFPFFCPWRPRLQGVLRETTKFSKLRFGSIAALRAPHQQCTTPPTRVRRATVAEPALRDACPVLGPEL